MSRLLLAFLLAAIPLFPQEACLVTLEEAVERALLASHRLDGPTDSLKRSQIGLALSAAEFDLKVVPDFKTAYLAKGLAGDGMSVSAGISLSKKFPLGTQILIEPNITRASHKSFSNGKVRITQPLFRGFGREATLSSLRAAQYDERCQQRSYLKAQLSLILDTVTTFYEVVKQEESVKLNGISLERIKRVRDAAKVKEKMGLASPGDLHFAGVELKGAEDNLHAAEDGYQGALDSFRELLALPLDLPLSLIASLNYGEVDYEIEEAIEIALNHRIEVEQACDALQEATRKGGIAKKQLLPKVDLIAEYTSCGDGTTLINSCAGKREARWEIGLVTSTDLTSKAARLGVEEAQITLGATEIACEQTRINISLQVKRALRALGRAKERIALEDERIRKAEGDLRLAQIKFERGMVHNTDVVTAEKTARSAKAKHLSAIIDHIIGEYQLLYAMGLLAKELPL